MFQIQDQNMEYDTDSDIDFMPVQNSKIDNSVKIISCSCGKSFASESLLRRHKCLHTPVNREHKCRCGAAFSFRGNLTRHLRKTCTMSNRKAPDSSCICTCGKQFGRKDSMERHKKVCTGLSGSGKCYVFGCSASFHHEIHLIRHLSHEHSVDACVKELTFESMSKFLEWKQEEEGKKFLYFSQADWCAQVR